MRSEELSEKQLLKCIYKKSAFAQKSDIRDFYTHNGQPADWEKTLIKDIRNADRINYKGRVFYTVQGPQTICYVFYQNFVYYFDSYYADCPILDKIVKKQKKKDAKKPKKSPQGWVEVDDLDYPKDWLDSL